MATIELYKNKINNMSNIIDNVRSEVSSYALGLTELFSKILAVDSPVLDKAISSLSTASKVQEQQINGLNAKQKEIEAFVLIAQITDNRVAKCISMLQKMFDRVYNYKNNSKSGVKTDTLAEWLYNNWGDHFSLGYMQYNSVDLNKMSSEELNNYINQLFSFNSDSLSDEDKTKIQAVLDYLSGISINNNMTSSEKLKITQYNKLYEMVQKEDGEKLKNLFKDVPNDYIDDIEAIKYIAYNSKGECHDIFFKYADKINISDYYTYYKDEPGNYFSPDDMSMHLNIQKMRDKNNSYGTFFHEAGHNIDLLIGKELTGESKYFSSAYMLDGKFHDVVYKDVESIVRAKVESYAKNEKNLSDNDKSLITDVLMGRKRETEIKNSNIDFAYRKVLEDITGAWKGKYSRQYQSGKEVGILEKNTAFMLREVMNGMTNNSLSVDEYNYNKYLGSNYTGGHPINWNDPDPNAGYVSQDYYYNADGSYTGSAETEYMAEYMRINMTNRVEEKNYVYGYLSKSWDEMQSALELQSMQK